MVWETLNNEKLILEQEKRRLNTENIQLKNDKYKLESQNHKLKIAADKLLGNTLDFSNKTRNAKEKHYNLSTGLIEAQETNKLLSNILEKNQIKEFKHNQAHQRILKSDLNLASKRIHIKENNHRKKLYYIFLLKHIFSYSLLSLLLTMFMRNGIISKTTAIYCVIILTVILFIVLILNYYHNRLRNVNYFYKRDFLLPKKDVTAPADNKCN